MNMNRPHSWMLLAALVVPVVLAGPSASADPPPATAVPPLASVVPAHGAFMQIQGAPGSSTDAAHAGWIQIVSFNFGVQSPRDPQTGLATGKRQHEPIIVTKPADKSSSILFQAAS